MHVSLGPVWMVPHLSHVSLLSLIPPLRQPARHTVPSQPPTCSSSVDKRVDKRVSDWASSGGSKSLPRSFLHSAMDDFRSGIVLESMAAFSLATACRKPERDRGEHVSSARSKEDRAETHTEGLRVSGDDDGLAIRCVPCMFLSPHACPHPPPSSPRPSLGGHAAGS